MYSHRLAGGTFAGAFRPTVIRDSDRRKVKAVMAVMCRGILVSACLMVLASQAIVAQARPDFSGSRILNRGASILSPAMSGVQSGTLDIEHADPRIRLRLTLVVNASPFETVVELTTDGRVQSGAQQGRSYTASASWEGDTLSIVSRSQGPSCETSITFRYQLGEGGRRVRAAESIRGCGRDQDNLWVFDRF